MSTVLPSPRATVLARTFRAVAIAEACSWIGLLIGMALSESFLSRLPLTTSLLYLIVGVLIGPHGFGLLTLDPVHDPTVLHHLAEVGVIVSLFTAGLKLRVHWRDRRWWRG